MPRPSPKNQYKVVKERMLFVILNPLNKEFFVANTLAHRMRKTYCLHYNGYKYRTENSIDELKAQGLKPCCFKLEIVNCTEIQAYRYQIVWTKIFMEQGYKNLDKGNITCYAADLLPANIPLYEARKNIDLSKLTSCKNCLFPNYGRTMCSLKKIICL